MTALAGWENFYVIVGASETSPPQNASNVRVAWTKCAILFPGVRARAGLWVQCGKRRPDVTDWAGRASA